MAHEAEHKPCQCEKGLIPDMTCLHSLIKRQMEAKREKNLKIERFISTRIQQPETVSLCH